MIRSVLLVSLLVALAAYVFKLMMMLDINKKVYSHRPGTCRRVEGVEHGAEDIALLEEEGVAFVTSGIVYLLPRKKEVQGKIFLYDLNQTGSWKVVPMKINGDYDQDNFHPHGISHIATLNGARLFVIVHSNLFEHSVMVFDWKRKSRVLDLIRIVKDEKFIRPNDLVAVSEDAFILSNDGYTQTPYLNLLEAMSFYPSGSVVYHDGKTSSYLIPKAHSANGVILNKDRSHLLVSNAMAKRMSVYKVGKDYRSLSHVVDVPLMTLPDNFCLDSSGAVWIGAHPVVKEAYAHFADCEDLSVRAPSQVLRIVFSKDYKSWEIIEPFADDGRLISGSSVAAPFKNQLLIGSVCRELVHCDLAPGTIY